MSLLLHCKGDSKRKRILHSESLGKNSQNIHIEIYLGWRESNFDWSITFSTPLDWFSQVSFESEILSEILVDRVCSSSYFWWEKFVTSACSSQFAAQEEVNNSYPFFFFLFPTSD
ncbi:hypothetical protein AABB24_023208 [Solanum stoloniferum]|uniref:Uncharacterized protein n=1 Tax=Solanum stoloniferum TaxID=62892 RepID=A0ABD2T382_9SOLN